LEVPAAVVLVVTLKVPGMRELAIRPFARQQLNSRMAALLATTTLVAAAALLPDAAHAQEATWLASPGSGDFNTAANWSPAAVPTGTTFFGTSDVTSLSFSAGLTTIGGWTFNSGASAYTFTNGQAVDFTGAGIIIHGGSASITNSDSLIFNNRSTAGSATITNTGGGSIAFSDTSTADSATITTSSGGGTFIADSASGGTARFILLNSNGFLLGGFLDIERLTTSGTTAGSIEGGGNVFLGSKNLAVGGNNLSTTFSGVIQDGEFGGGTGGSLTKEGTGTLTLLGANTYTGGTMVNGGLIDFSAANNFGTGQITLNGGGLQWATGTPTDISGQLTAIGSHGATFDTNGNNVTLASALSGVGGVTKAGSGTLTLSSANTYIGGATVEAGTLRAGIAGAFVGNTAYAVNGGTLDLNGFNLTMSSLSGTGGTVALGAAALAINQVTDTSYAGAVTGTGSLTKTGSGTLTLSGVNTYTGTTTVNDGTLAVNGTMTNATMTVNSSGTIAGTGTVGATQINSGGTFAPGSGTPGSSMTVAGNIAFQSGALYLVQVNPATRHSQMSRAPRRSAAPPSMLSLPTAATSPSSTRS
jgi:autotransporter-associated beta strand protein